LHRLFEGLRDDTDAEQRLLGCVQRLNLPFGVLFEPSGEIAHQIAEDSCDLGPCCIAIRGIDAEIGQVAVAAGSGKNATACPDPALASAALCRMLGSPMWPLI
jgi:hypothetical protein